MKKECIVIGVLALVIGILSTLPHLLGYWEFGGDYEPFTKLFTSSIVFDEVAVYASSAAFFKETNNLPGETEIFELKSFRSIKYYIPIFFEGLAGKVAKNNRSGWLVLKFLFPALSFVLAFHIAQKLSGSVWVGVLAATIFFSLGFGARTLFDLDSAQPILFSRMHSPAATLPFFLLFIVGLMKMAGGSRKGVALAGITGGLLFYTYYYYQLTAILALIILFLWYAWRKEWIRVKFVIFAGIITNLIAVPWYANYVKTAASSPNFLARWQGAVYLPPAEHILLFAVFVFAFIAARYAKRKKAPADMASDTLYGPLLALIGAAAFLEFLVGTTYPMILEPAHFTQQIIISLGLLTTISFYGPYLLRTPSFKKIIAGVVLIVLGTALVKQFFVWENSKTFFIASAKERAAERLITLKTTPEDVIAVNNPYLNSVLPARVWRYRFYGMYGFSGLGSVSNDENLKRYVITRKLFGASWKEIEDELRGAERTIEPPLKTATIPFLLTFDTRGLKTEQINAIKIFYDNTPRDFLPQRKLTHIVSLEQGEYQTLTDRADRLGLELAPIAEENGVSLYRIDRN